MILRGGRLQISWAVRPGPGIRPERSPHAGDVASSLRFGDRAWPGAGRLSDQYRPPARSLAVIMLQPRPPADVAVASASLRRQPFSTPGCARIPTRGRHSPSASPNSRRLLDRFGRNARLFRDPTRIVGTYRFGHGLESGLAPGCRRLQAVSNNHVRRPSAEGGPPGNGKIEVRVSRVGVSVGRLTISSHRCRGTARLTAW